MNDSAIHFRPPPRDMSEAQFVQRFGGVYERTPSIAAKTWRDNLDASHDSVDGLANALALTVDNLGHGELLKLVRAHPDLAGRAAVAGELTPESTSEQSSAGIDQCTADEFARFAAFNERYKQKFGFTFVMAVKGSNRFQILENFEQRLQNDAEAEFERALQEIHQIARFRLREIAAMQDSAAENNCAG